MIELVLLIQLVQTNQDIWDKSLFVVAPNLHLHYGVRGYDAIVVKHKFKGKKRVMSDELCKCWWQ